MAYPNRDKIAKEIGNCFSKKRPEEDKLYLFADELLKNLNPDEIILSAAKSIKMLSPYHFGTALQNLSDQAREENWENKQEIKKFIKKTEKFYKDYFALKHRLARHPSSFLYSAWSEYHQKSGDWIDNDEGIKRNIRYDDDGNIIPIFPEKMKIFEEYLSELYNMLNLELETIPAKIGRPEDKRQNDFLACLYVMTECLLEVKAGISLTTTPFRRITDYCLSLVGDKITGNFPHIMSFCFTDFFAIRNMAYKYKEYDRLDLFVEHVLRTDYVDSFREEFDDEWADWKKPINFNKLY